MYDKIRPGKIWLDNNGKRIQAHGGSLLFAEGRFYWYGENKEGITGTASGEPCPYWHHGVKLYSSEDLYNWVDEGLVMEESDDIGNPFHPARIMDRPHILYHRKNKQFVLYAKTSNQGFGECVFSVCVGESLKKMRFLHEIKPGPYQAGDFDLVEKDGKAYLIFENPHTEMICAELSDDYLNFSGVFSSHIPEECPPYVREAPAFFERNGEMFLLTSGTTGYFPNPSKTYRMDSFHGEWKDLGFTCLDDRNRNSFHAQFSSVFHHPSRPSLYIALGDRWLNDLPEDLPNMEEAFYEMFTKKPIKKKNLYSHNLTDSNTSEADYVWLPIVFDENGEPHIAYRREWRVEDFF